MQSQLPIALNCSGIIIKVLNVYVCSGYRDWNVQNDSRLAYHQEVEQNAQSNCDAVGLYVSDNLSNVFDRCNLILKCWYA